MVKLLLNILTCSTLLLAFSLTSSAQSEFSGAWETKDGDANMVSIVTDQYFSVASFLPGKFIRTLGGSWKTTGSDQVMVTIEFDSEDSTNVGKTFESVFRLAGDKLTVYNKEWKRIDDGTPGVLNDAWLMTGRKRNGTGDIETRTPGPRKTMKILSGTRFQWIAYNTETGQFFGTGGGTYSSIEGNYTENIEFFSRDNSRVGASLPFIYALKDGAWHHSGKSSKGDPIYEIWTTRSTPE